MMQDLVLSARRVVLLAALAALGPAAGAACEGAAPAADAVHGGAETRADVSRADVPGADLPAAEDVPAASDAVADAWRGPWTCPDDMVLVEVAALTACVDRYEASRKDATWHDAGTDGSVARSAAGVLPWVLDGDRAVAAAACGAAGKRLCGAAEWEAACAGPEGLAYPYGDLYRDDVCNGFEAHGPGAFRLEVTGAMERCVSGFGAFDMSGNLWELVTDADDLLPRGGAYDSTDGVSTHRCAFVRLGGRTDALGFRCCRAAEPLR